MNPELMKMAGFGPEVAAVEKGLCPFCGKKVGDADFEDGSISLREFQISGLCQNCQNETFGGN